MDPAREPLLEMAVQDAVRRIARRHLAAAARALPRVGRDRSSLHAFRVAVRRLRSLLRAYRPWLGRPAGKKVRRRLRRLMRATNAARESDVLLDWLAAQAPALGKEDRPGFEWMRSRLRTRRSKARTSARRPLAREFARTAALVKERFERAGEAEVRSFRSAFLEVVGPAAEALREKLGAISSADDQANVHQARIRAKRLRYLVEPLRSSSEAAGALVKRLRRLQDLLGDLHDLDLIETELAAAVEEAAREEARRMFRLAVAGKDRRLSRERRRDERLGILALAARARARRDALYARLAQEWLADRAGALERELRTLQDALAAGAGSPAAPLGA